MKLLSRRRALSGLTSLAVGGLILPARAQGFPQRPLRLIVPWVAGGSGDTQSRLISQRLAEMMGQPIVVDNRGGANGELGTRLAVQSPPDGYTLVFGVTGQISLGPLLRKEPGFDPLTDLVPVSGLSNHRLFLVVPAASGVHSLQELVAAAKSSPGRMSYGSSGIGAVSHLAAAQLANLTGASMTHIPYQSASQVTRAMLAGDVHFTFLVGGDLSAYQKAGTLTAIAVTGEGRSAILPDVPTLAEQGLSGWMPGSVWFAFFAPAKTPPATIELLHGQIAKVLAEPQIVDRLNKIYFAEPWPVTSSELTSILRTEKTNFAQLLKAVNVSPS